MPDLIPELCEALRRCAAIVDSFLNGSGSVTPDEMDEALMAATAALRKADNIS